MKKNILAIQLSAVSANFAANCAKVSSLFDKFYSNLDIYTKDSKSRPDIIFLPEVWTLGWDTACFQKYAEENEAAVGFLSNLAKKYNTNIVGGSYIRKTDNVYRNTCPVINRKGELCAMYDKIHLYSPDGEAKAVTAGNTPLIVNIEGLKIGLSICYDIRFPELFRSYMANENKPDMLVNLSAWPKTRRAQYEAMAKSRAIENQSYFLALSQTGLIRDDIYNSGYSLLVHPMGESVAILNEDEGFIYEVIDTDITDNVRKTYPNLLNRRVNDFGFHPEYIETENRCLR